MSCIIFLGPSLAWKEAASILEAEYRPPAGRGDIAAAADQGFKFIGLIDGVFYQRAAVAPREIIYAMEGGATVVGGSSMGALRAAELDSCGMIGVGKIYEWYKQGTITSDDEVALAFHPETYQPLSEPLVNVRATLGLLYEEKLISGDEIKLLLEAAKKTAFQLRNHMRIVQESILLGLERKRASTILGLMESRRVDQKRIDALAVLGRLKEFAVKPG
jgi:hypothetical protein